MGTPFEPTLVLSTSRQRAGHRSAPSTPRATSANPRSRRSRRTGGGGGAPRSARRSSLEQHVILVVLAHPDRPDALPRDEIRAAGDHRQDAAAGVSRLAFAQPRRAVGGIGHVKDAVDLRHARVFHAARVGGIVRDQHRCTQPVEMHSVGAHRIADAAHPVEALGAVVHVKQAVVVDHRRVEDIVALPVGGRIGQQDGFAGWRVSCMGDYS